jgi:ketopantoate hydroxymethyltransferase
MSAKTPSQRPKRKKSKTTSRSAYAASTLAVARQNLINMVAVSAVSGTVLLGLLAAKHF